eukprot:gene22677-biopygen4257
MGGGIEAPPTPGCGPNLARPARPGPAQPNPVQPNPTQRVMKPETSGLDRPLVWGALTRTARLGRVDWPGWPGQGRAWPAWPTTNVKTNGRQTTGDKRRETNGGGAPGRPPAINTFALDRSLRRPAPPATTAGMRGISMAWAAC